MAKRLLLVDDDPRKLSLLQVHVTAIGHTCLLARSGAEALEVFDRERPDLVLLDVFMPGLDGMDVLTHIRARDGEGYVPVILVTASTDRDARVRGLRAGADEFLEVPIDRAILEARVRTLLKLKATTDELAARNAALERLQREQQELTNFLVHDLKGPIGVLKMVMEGVRESLTPDQGELAESLLDGEESVVRLRGMVEELLAVSRLEQATFPLRREPIEVGALLTTVSEMYAREAKDRGVSVQLQGGAVANTSADRGLLRRVLENLLDNSLRHTPPGGRVVLGSRATARGLEVVVSNTSPPIPLDEREVIFEKFSRGKGSVEGRGNAGLGLYFCKRAIEAHGGRIRVEQTSEFPTSFVLSLPGNQGLRAVEATAPG
jgi:two-component system, sensor histidine kinase and response regulator